MFCILPSNSFVPIVPTERKCDLIFFYPPYVLTGQISSSNIIYATFICHKNHSSFIIHHSSFIIHHSSFIIHHSSFIIHHSSFIIHHSSFIIHYSPLTIHFSTSL
ncbi:hypothetical protein [Ferruginibacter sp. SUN106]|uniref:hypothetical protein n=1 Tax=Ferruginibacter sp. SUN106 TaxID=2978348 RepID=UPI003D35E34F